MASKGSLKPQAYDDIREIWKRKDLDDAEKSGVDPEDQKIFALAGMPGWEVLRAHIDNMKIGLDKRLSEAVLGGLSDDQIKRDATFSVLGKELLDSIINKVEDSALVVEDIIKNERTKAERE